MSSLQHRSQTQKLKVSCRSNKHIPQFYSLQKQVSIANTPSRTEIIYTGKVANRFPTFFTCMRRFASGTFDGGQIYRNTFAWFRKFFVIKLTDQFLPELVLDTVSTL